MSSIKNPAPYIKPNVGVPITPPDVPCPHGCEKGWCESYESYEAILAKYDFSDFKRLYLVIEPAKFVINPEKGTKFSIKSPSKIPQDVIISCHSFLYEIKNARRKFGLTSQWFHVFKQDEKKEFEIVLKDMKDESMENFENSPVNLASGVIEITHYKSRLPGSLTEPKVTDSDTEWEIEGTTLLIRTGCREDEYHGYWCKDLETEFETENVKKRKQKFFELRIAQEAKEGIEKIQEAFSKKPMFATEEYPSKETEREATCKRYEEKLQKEREEHAEYERKLQEKYKKQQEEYEAIQKEKEKKKSFFSKLIKQKKK